MAKALVDFINDFPTEPGRQRAIDKFSRGSGSAVLPRIKFINTNGFNYTYHTVDNYGSVSTRALNSDYTESTSKTSPNVEPMTIFGGSAKTDYSLIAAKGDAARQDEKDKMMIAAGKFFDKKFFNGNPANDGKDIRGLKSRLAGNQLLWAGTNGGALTLDLMDQALDSVTGINSQKVIYMNATLRRKLSSLVKANAGGKGLADAQTQLPSYDGAEIVIVGEDESYNPILDFNETRGNSSVTSSIYVVRFGQTTDEEFVQGLISGDLMRQNPPANFGTYVLDVIETNIGIGVFHPMSAARIGGILNS